VLRRTTTIFLGLQTVFVDHTNRNTRAIVMAMSTTSTALRSVASDPDTHQQHNNVLVSSARLVPLYGSMTVAHSTRERVLEMLQRVGKKAGDEKSMIVDISATTWNWDTYAIVAGKPVPIELKFPDEATMRKYLNPTRVDDTVAVSGEEQREQKGSGDANDNTANTRFVVQKGVLVPQQSQQENDAARTNVAWVWVPEGSVLKSVTTPPSTTCNSNESDTSVTAMTKFVFEAPIDPNNDRLEHFEQCVVADKMLYKQRAKLAHECMRNMARFYNLDRIVCWDLSWGIWEAVVDNDNNNNNSNGPNKDGDGFPRMTLLNKDRNNGNDNGNESLFPAVLDGNDDDAVSSFYDYSRPITPELLATTLKSVSGYYLVGGNTYTMSLFHHMWDQQQKQGQPKQGHMQLLRDLLAENKLCYLGHSAGAIMSGPNILTATFKGIDAFSIVTQPYNAPYIRLPPSETTETFFVSQEHKNDLSESRTQMLRKMKRYGAWRGYHVVEALTFPHYDSRPRFASFPQSAETYLRATNEKGQFQQPGGRSLLVGNSGTASGRIEPGDVTEIREATNKKLLPCYPIANGHAIVLSPGGSKIVESLSPAEEEGGTLHWDTYMPNVPDRDYENYAPGRTCFKKGSFTNDANTMAGDRSDTSPYHGARIHARLDALGLPNPSGAGVYQEGGSGGLFRS